MSSAHRSKVLVNGEEVGATTPTGRVRRQRISDEALVHFARFYFAVDTSANAYNVGIEVLRAIGFAVGGPRWSEAWRTASTPIRRRRTAVAK